ncbi:hypothetical protein [Allorhodopirellula heiligendammensis]|uniref:Glutamine amidotransferase domain-containing protein n=1 Tax=Allorhodopirellula heiligendammensis TaxID=2714739 RepID=A0A5C6BH43_9BACT|nr:hypothetical protein [Allorhodopirellula heiligendammensis]TWU11052.1 hypothetical protein Poly21_49590 [Allorhodopirellula heiligendammensis]
MSDCMLLNRLIPADVSLTWLPAWQIQGFIAIGIACLLMWACVRYFWGASQVHRHWGLWALRAAAVVILVLILFGPTIIDERSGAIMRPSMLYLFDGSQSMQLGQDETRWEESLRFLTEAQSTAGALQTGDEQAFRFGHRLEPLAKPNDNTQSSPESLTLTSNSATAGEVGSIAPPDASDSRLGEALRQLLPQVNERQTAGVVMFSDGRVRGTESVERLAELFAAARVPLHVVPVGRASGNGDIAVVSLVVPARVRKYTENELQVFLRSYGFTQQQTTVRIISRSKISDLDSATLATVPITLSGGAQSVSLKFRVDEHPEDLVVVVDPLEGEVTERNNRVETHVDIDRTKVRVLYVENAATATRSTPSFLNQILSFGGSASTPAEADIVTVQNALQSDEDVECVVLTSTGGSAPRGLRDSTSNSELVGFPKTRAELFAYDCVVFSDVSPSVLDEEQVSWLAQWIEGRGGGLIVAGGDALILADWSDSPLLPLLPTNLLDRPRSYPQPREVDVTMPQHPIWRLRWEQASNDQLLGALPSLAESGAVASAKSTADVLAKNRDDGTPTIVAHRVGRGRVLVSTASLGGTALTDLSERWGPQPERVASKFWRNLVYWVTEGSSTGRRRLVAHSDKRFYRPGEPLSILAMAYDEGARRTNKYSVWAMFEPASLEDLSLYSPLLWPDNVVRDSGEVSPKLAWGEELMLDTDRTEEGYRLDLLLSESGGVGDGGLRIEMTAYEGTGSQNAFDHGTQVDSTSLAIQILSDPFELQNPLPNHELMARLASLSGGDVLNQPRQLAQLLKDRKVTSGPPHRDLTPAWSRWWLWLTLLGLLTAEWVWRKAIGL